MSVPFTDDELDVLLERFDLTEPKLQRRIIGRFIYDRSRLMDAAREAAGMLRVCESELQCEPAPDETRIRHLAAIRGVLEKALQETRPDTTEPADEGSIPG